MSRCKCAPHEITDRDCVALHDGCAGWGAGIAGAAELARPLPHGQGRLPAQTNHKNHVLPEGTKSHLGTGQRFPLGGDKNFLVNSTTSVISM